MNFFLLPLALRLSHTVQRLDRALRDCPSGRAVLARLLPLVPALRSTASAAGFRFCLAASSLLWGVLNSHARASPASAPRPPDVVQERRAALARHDLPVPKQGASAHARVSDRAGPGGRSQWRARPNAFRHQNGVGAQDDVDFAMMAYAIPCDVRRCPRGHLRTARGRCGLLLLHRSGLHHLLLPSPGALSISTPSNSMREAEPMPNMARHKGAPIHNGI